VRSPSTQAAGAATLSLSLGTAAAAGLHAPDWIWIATTTETSEELLTRVRELRAQAAATDIEGYRAGALKVAVRYEQTAAARLISGIEDTGAS
jgi:hypothetical protein